MISCFYGEAKRRSKRNSICSSEGVFTCPEDNLPLDNAKIYADTDAEVAIMGSVVYCIHYKEGCKWSDELRKLQGHLNMCKFDAIPCANQCGAMIPRLVMEDHLAFTCPKRRARCDYCSRDFTGETLESHLGSCQLEPIYCENKCGSKVARRHHSLHRQLECSKRLSACRHCGKEFVLDTLALHVAKCPRLPVPCPRRCGPDAHVAKEELEQHLAEHCPAAPLIPCEYKDVGCKFKGSRASLEQHLACGAQAHLSLLRGVVARQERAIGGLRAALQALSLDSSGTLLWRVGDWARRSAQPGCELRSQPFLTAPHGYRLAATLFPRGNGAGEGSHLSLYIRLLPGEFDALLPWPFAHTVTFALFDQDASGQDVVESFVPDPSWKNFQRPSREPDALGFGFPRFVSLELLKKRAFVKDDVMFIKVTVDASKTIAV